MYNLLGRAIHAHFAQDSKDGHLISDNAADTGSLTPKYCHITFTSTQEVLVNGCHPTMVKPYFLASGITAVDLPSGPHLVGQHEVPLIPNSLISGLLGGPNAEFSGLLKVVLIITNVALGENKHAG